MVNIRVGFFYFIEEQYRMGALADGISEDSALLVANVSGRRTDKPADGVLLLVFAHIEAVKGNPQVFGQCRNWILRHFPEADLVEVSSTTRAAEIARDKAAEGAAALGGPLAAELNGLTMIEECIQDRATNTTRFLVIGEKTCPPTGRDRTSLLFAIHDRPGSLVRALQAFEHFDINMSKIESRPSKRKDWEYIFYVDLAGHCEDPKVAEALEELGRHCSMVKLLGSYPDAGE